MLLGQGVFWILANFIGYTQILLVTGGAFGCVQVFLLRKSPLVTRESSGYTRIFFVSAKICWLQAGFWLRASLFVKKKSPGYTRIFFVKKKSPGYTRISLVTRESSCCVRNFLVTRRIFSVTRGAFGHLEQNFFFCHKFFFRALRVLGCKFF